MSDERIEISLRRLKAAVNGDDFAFEIHGGSPFDDCKVLLDEIERLRAALATAEEQQEALQKIVSWSEAYPLDIFPEPDFKKAAGLLKAGGITLDAISASCMRHVVERVGKIAKDALSAPPEVKA
jgi:hypothetical protein